MEAAKTTINTNTQTPAAIHAVRGRGNLMMQRNENEMSSVSSSLPFIQRKLTIGSADDVYEKEADAMADKVMRMEMPGQINFYAGKNNVQRKCAHCEEEEKLQRKENSAGESSATAPPIVHDVLNSPSGKSMDESTRSFMETRFNYDFSSVKIHNNELAAKSASSINALAYTVGNNVFFNSGQYNASTDSGRRLLAHELTHVVQQKENISEKRIQRQSSIKPIPRGPNPSSCLTPLCSQLKSAACLKDPKACAQTWITDVISCLNSNSAASNATHASEIIANTKQELIDYITYINSLQPVATSSDRQNYIDWLNKLCLSKQRELFIEFHHNVIFDNVPTVTQSSQSKPWDYNLEDWDAIEQALAAIPDEHLWGRSASQPLIHFKREMQSSLGASVGGETDPRTNAITIYDTGTGSTPFGRSASTGIPATSQTIRHEVGHTVEYTLSASGQSKNLIDNIIGWSFFPVHFLISNPPANDTHRLFQSQLCTELKFLDSSGNCDRDKMKKFIDSVAVGTNLVFNNRVYSKTKSSFMSWPVGAVPDGPEFSYARTSPSDYFAEVYSFAVSNAEFIYRSLPLNQIEWLKQNVFHTQPIYDELISPYLNLAAGGNETLLTRYQALIQSAQRQFTRQQLERISQQLQSLFLQITSSPAGGVVT